MDFFKSLNLGHKPKIITFSTGGLYGKVIFEITCVPRFVWVYADN